MSSKSKNNIFFIGFKNNFTSLFLQRVTGNESDISFNTAHTAGTKTRLTVANLKKGLYNVEIVIHEILEFYSIGNKHIKPFSENSIVIFCVNPNDINHQTLFTNRFNDLTSYIPKDCIVVLLINKKRDNSPIIPAVFKQVDLSSIREIIWSDIDNSSKGLFFDLLSDIIINKYTKRLELARSLILENQQKKAKTLDLGNCALTNLAEVNTIFACTHLEELILSNEWAEHKAGQWHKRKSINKGESNHLGNFPKEIGKLQNLKKLYAGGDWKLTGDKKWNKWRISDIKPILRLRNIEYLNLSNNSLEFLPSLLRLPRLRILHINNNLIGEVRNRRVIPSLEEIYISNNNLQSVSFLNKFPSINTIDLHANEIKSLAPLLPIIKRLNLSNTKWIKNTINVGKNPLEEPPLEIINIGKNAVIKYFEDLESEGSDINKEVKFILVGNSGVGKTTLAKYLDNERNLNDPHPPTHWMEERQITSKNVVSSIGEKCTINLFDFGGHDYYHDAHQIFFDNNTIYILLWNTETNNLKLRTGNYSNENDKNVEFITQDYPLKYWLDSIKHFSLETKSTNFNFEIESSTDYGCQVLVVQNKAISYDKIDQIDNKGLKSQYEFIFDIINVAIKEKRNTGHLDSLINEMLNSIDIVGAKLPKYYTVIKDHILRHEGETILNVSEFIAFCNSRISKPINRDQAEYLLNYLKQIGVVLLSTFNSKISRVFLNKSWTIKQIHKVLDNLTSKNGEFDRDFVVDILDNGSIGQSKAIIQLMVGSKIIFKNPHSEKYIAPLYLPSKPIQAVDLFIQSNRIPFRRIQYIGFIHKNVILSIFQKYGNFTVSESHSVSEPKYYYWKNGLILKDNSTTEVIMIKFHLGDNNGNAFIDIFKMNDVLESGFMNRILNDIKDINTGYETEELVTINGQDFIPLEELHQNETDNIWTFKHNGKYHKLVHYNKYLKNTNRMKKIFISYSKKDLSLVNTFKDHLSGLEKDGKVSSWYCTELTAGGEWDVEIKKHFDESDIVCFMISPNFMRTKYIHEYEIAKAFERKERDNSFKIVPIILDFCNWKTSHNNLGKFTALPYTAKPIMDFKNQNMGWYLVERCLSFIIDDEVENTDHTLYTHASLPQDVRDLFTRIVNGNVDA